MRFEYVASFIPNDSAASTFFCGRLEGDADVHPSGFFRLVPTCFMLVKILQKKFFLFALLRLNNLFVFLSVSFIVKACVFYCEGLCRVTVKVSRSEELAASSLHRRWKQTAAGALITAALFPSVHTEGRKLKV